MKARLPAGFFAFGPDHSTDIVNYRQGFLRIYVVLAACWAALWLYLAASELIQQRKIEVPIRLSNQIDEARRNGYSDDKIVGYLEKNRSDLAQQIQQEQRIGHSSGDILKSLPETLEVDPSAIQRDATGKWVIQHRDYGEAVFSLEMALIPPAVGYLILFLIVPWIGRGFRASS
jgi:hypothetical protein